MAAHTFQLILLGNNELVTNYWGLIPVIKSIGGALIKHNSTVKLLLLAELLFNT